MKHGAKCQRIERKLQIAYKGLRFIMETTMSNNAYQAAKDTIATMQRVRTPK
jgi:hypothetical protein